MNDSLMDRMDGQLDVAKSELSWTFVLTVGPFTMTSHANSSVQRLLCRNPLTSVFRGHLTPGSSERLPVGSLTPVITMGHIY